MSEKQMASGRPLFDPLAAVEKENSESFESDSHGGAVSRSERVVQNNQYGKCPKCVQPMAITKNAENKDVFFCQSCTVTMPCKS